MGLLNWLRNRRGRRGTTASVVTPEARSVTPSAPVAESAQVEVGRISVPTGGFAVVDVETTGLIVGRDRVLEIAVIAVDASGRVIDEWTSLLNPDGPVGATHIHGLTALKLRQAPRFHQVAGELTARLVGRVLVAHNARFDLAFLSAEYARAGWTMPPAPHLCTLEESGRYMPELDRRRLADCCWSAGVPLNDAHAALGDARATAGLLAYYLSTHGERPTPEHRRMLQLACQVTWPPVPMTTAKALPRNLTPSTAVPIAVGTLWAMLDALPLSTVIDEGAPTTSQAYLEVLFAVLEDGILTHDEAGALVDVAKIYSLTREQVEAAHRGFLLALAHRIIEDGKVTREERRVLIGAAQALGFDDELPRAVLDEARAAFDANRAQACKPLPPSWNLGRPLRIGDAVVFTGCDQLLRARLEGHAQSVGLRVTGSVSGRTSVLVTDGANPNTNKARAARHHGTPSVTPGVFAVLLEYIQPSSEMATGPTPPAEETVTAGPAVREDPATIRAWAHRHGFPIAQRGRIGAEIVTAYRAACASATEPIR